MRENTMEKTTDKTIITVVGKEHRRYYCKSMHLPCK